VGRAVLIRLLRREAPSPEDSRTLRLVVALMVEIAVVAVVAQGAVGPETAAAAIVLVPAGYVFSYVRRCSPSIPTKLVLALGLLIALGSFLRSVEGVGSFDEAREPLASLFLWVQILHAFDVPRRRDLGFSVVSSLILMAEAGALSFGTGFVLFLVPYLSAGAAFLFLTLRPPPEATPAVLEVRRPAGALRRPLALGRRIAVWAALSALSVAVVFAALPRLPGLDVAVPPFRADRATAIESFDGRVVNPGLSIGPDGVSEFSDLAYPGFGSSLDLRARGRLSDQVVLRVRSPQAALWRGQGYDSYDGTAWTTSDREVLAIGRTFGERFEMPPTPGAAPPGVPTTRVLATFYVQAELPNVVFGAWRPEQVYFPASQLMTDRHGSLRAPILLEEGVVYSVESVVPAASPELLRTVGGAPGEATGAGRYLALPSGLPERVIRLAERLTAPASTTYEAVLAVETWLRRNTAYNLDVPADPPGVDAVDHFLFERREGFCEHIASAMAVLLRAGGVPTRLVTGFGPGHRNPFTGYWEVRASDAHAWVEVLYPGVGWIPHDPTFGVPPADPGWADRFLGPELLESVGRVLAAVVPTPIRTAVRAAGRAVADVVSVWPFPVASAGLVLAAVVLGRRRGRRRVSGPPPTGAARAFVDLERAMAFRGHPRRDHQTPREYLRALGPFLPAGERADAEVVVGLFELDRYAPAEPGHDEVALALAAAGRLRRGEPSAPDDP
jgi:transglutaminase-like putative cysteine protease